VTDAVAAATATLAAAGVTSPRVDAELLAAHVLGVSRSRLAFAAMTRSQAARFDDLVAKRAQRIPLQHLIGAPFYGLELDVGPGVFIPRPETELLVEWGLSVLSRGDPIVVDLCSGSGAIAIAIAARRPDAVVYAVERSPTALEWLRRNTTGRSVRVVSADVRSPDLLSELAGRVDLVLCNPPYVPDGTPVPVEVSRYDPPEAVFAGPDGLALMPSVIAVAGRLLRAGGALGIEHDERHGAGVVALLGGPDFTSVMDHEDLAGCPRFATALRLG